MYVCSNEVNLTKDPPCDCVTSFPVHIFDIYDGSVEKTALETSLISNIHGQRAASNTGVACHNMLLPLLVY